MDKPDIWRSDALPGWFLRFLAMIVFVAVAVACVLS